MSKQITHKHTETYLNLSDGGSITVAYLLTKRGPFVKLGKTQDEKKSSS